VKTATVTTTTIILVIASAAGAQRATTRATRFPDVGSPLITVFLPDLCEGAVDPFRLAQQRERFFTAAGADNELTKEEFIADAGRKNGFVRTFDTWDALLAYDSDAGETIDWPEAKRYRLGFRKKMLALFDADRDGHLTREERNEANRALATGKVAPDTFETLLAFAEGLEGLLDELPGLFDEASDLGQAGQVQPPVRGVSPQPVSTQVRRRVALSAQLSGTGRELIPLDRIRRALLVLVFDANKDGRLSRPEKQIAESFATRLSYSISRKLRRSMDPDGDGRVSRREAGAFIAQINRASPLLVSKLARSADSDSDGFVSDTEAESFADKVVERVVAWAESFCLACDGSGDGRFSKLELSLLMRAISRELASRFRQHDADKDGRLDGREIVALVTTFAEQIGLLYVPVGPVR